MRALVGIAALAAGLLVGGSADVDGVAAERTWERVASMSQRRSYVAAAELAGRIYAAGGLVGATGRPLATVSRYDPGRDAWTTLAPLPEPRAGAGAAGHDGALYVIGGAHRLAWQPIADVDVLVPE